MASARTWRVAVLSILLALAVVGIFITAAGTYLRVPRPKYASFARLQQPTVLRQKRALKVSRQTEIDSQLIDYNHDHQSLSMLFRKLHHLEDQLRFREQMTGSTMRRSLIDDYMKTKLLIDSKLKSQDENVSSQNCPAQPKPAPRPAPSTRVIKIALCSFPLAEQMKGLTIDPPVRDRSLIIVLASMRTGSSFFGQLLERSNDVMYFYEPLRGLYTRAHKENVTQSDLQKMQLQLLTSISMCNFGTNMGQLLLQDISMSSYSSRTNSQTFVSPPLCPHACEKKVFCPMLERHTVNQVCLSKKATVLKTIRITDVKVLKPLFTDLDGENQGNVDTLPSRIKIAHLVRDPRAVIFSKMRMKGQLEREYSINHGKDSKPKSKLDLVDSGAQLFCDVLWTNLQYAEMHPDWLKGNYHIFRFEDIAMSVKSSVMDMYVHFGLNVTQSVLDWITENTQADTDANAKSVERRNPFGTSRDSKMIAKAWRVLLDTPDGRNLVQVIEKRCQQPMNFLGYKLEIN
jgi:keratan sulfate 6-sulfotransferase 1